VASSNNAVSTDPLERWTYRTTLPRINTLRTELCCEEDSVSLCLSTFDPMLGIFVPVVVLRIDLFRLESSHGSWA